MLLRRVEGKQIIVPLRNPQDVWRSWARRDNFREHHLKGHMFPYARFFGAWYTLHTLDMLFDVDFIAVDQRKDPRIADWSRVGHDDRPTHDGVSAIDLNHLHYLPFVQRHYGLPRGR